MGATKETVHTPVENTPKLTLCSWGKTTNWPVTPFFGMGTKTRGGGLKAKVPKGQIGLRANTLESQFLLEWGKNPPANPEKKGNSQISKESPKN